MNEYILERGYFTPNDPEIMAQSDSVSIQRAVDAALETGLGRVVIPRYNKRTGQNRWDVDKAVILDSGIEIVLDGCYIRQTDGSMDNVFRNFPEDGMRRRTLAEEQHDIIIRGVGNAVIDGGIHNGLTEMTCMKNGLPHIFQNNTILLHNLRDFRLENFTILNQRHWAINLCYAEKGVIASLNIVCDGKTQNLDGIDLRIGCNHILLQNLQGQAGDDFIALTALNGARSQAQYTVEGKSMDIHHVIIQNVVATSAECTVIALRNHDGIKIHDITIDNVYDTVTSQTAAEEGTFSFFFDLSKRKFSKSPYALLRIGHDLFSHSSVCQMGDVYNIHVTNLHARCNNAIILNMCLENSYFGNIYAGNDVDTIISSKSERSEHPFGINLRNTVFENIFFQCTGNPDAVAFDFGLNTKECTLENVTIRNAYLGSCSRILNMEHQGTLALENICAADLRNKITVREGSVVTLDGQPL